MSKMEKLLTSIFCGTQDASIKFSHMRKLLKILGFSERIKGGHFIYWHDEVIEIINIQPKGAFCKAYQVKQIRSIILKYKMGDSNV